MQLPEPPAVLTRPRGTRQQGAGAVADAVGDDWQCRDPRLPVDEAGFVHDQQVGAFATDLAHRRGKRFDRGPVGKRDLRLEVIDHRPLQQRRRREIGAVLHDPPARKLGRADDDDLGARQPERGPQRDDRHEPALARAPSGEDAAERGPAFCDFPLMLPQRGTADDRREDRDTVDGALDVPGLHVTPGKVPETRRVEIGANGSHGGARCGGRGPFTGTDRSPGKAEQPCRITREGRISECQQRGTVLALQRALSSAAQAGADVACRLVQKASIDQGTLLVAAFRHASSG